MVASSIGAAPARIRGRTALVTGAGNGLGRAIALALSAAGARVILVGRTPASLKAVALELTSAGGSARVAQADTSDPAAVQSLAGDLADEDVSILVNNAGVAGPVAPLTEIDIAAWD